MYYNFFRSGFLRSISGNTKNLNNTNLHNLPHTNRLITIFGYSELQGTIYIVRYNRATLCDKNLGPNHSTKFGRYSREFVTIVIVLTVFGNEKLS